MPLSFVLEIVGCLVDATLSTSPSLYRRPCLVQFGLTFTRSKLPWTRSLHFECANSAIFVFRHPRRGDHLRP
jgi:hypothetical protein